MALVLYEAPAYTPLTSPTRIFDLPHSGRVTISQHWGEDGTRTGGAVWDAAQVLGHYIDEHHERWMNQSSLELGAGMGFASIVAARCGFTDVLATDGDANLLSFARSNADENAEAHGNAATVRVETLQWGDTAALNTLLPLGAATPDVILASDVIYLGSARSWGSFLSLVATLCRRRREEMSTASTSVLFGVAPAVPPPAPIARHDGTFSAAGDPLVLLSHTRRYANEEQHFFGEARRHRFNVTELPENALHATWAGGRSVLYELRWLGDSHA